MWLKKFKQLFKDYKEESAGFEIPLEDIASFGISVTDYPELKSTSKAYLEAKDALETVLDKINVERI